MRSLDLPLRNEHEDYKRCASLRAGDDKAALERLIDDVFEAYSLYDEVAFEDATLTAFKDSDAKILKETFRLLDSGRSMQALRRELLSIGKNDRCPFCDRVPVSALDHHLPKSHFPHYSVMARNLVPICDRCNREKLNKKRTSRALRFFHPYYDELPSRQLLRVTVETDPIVYIRFGVDRDSSASELSDIMHFTITELKLDRYYEAESYDELGDLSSALDNAYEAGGGEYVRAHLAQMRDSFISNKGRNYWKSCLYTALSETPSFCDDAFRQLLPG